MTAIAITLYSLVVLAALIGISAGLAMFALWLRARRAAKHAGRSELADAAARGHNQTVAPPNLPDDNPATEELPVVPG